MAVVSTQTQDEHTRQEYADFRGELRQILAERRIASNPAWGNDEIVSALRQELKGKPLADEERFKHGRCNSWSDEYFQLRQGVVDSFAYSFRPLEQLKTSSPIEILAKLREALGLETGAIFLRGINFPYFERKEAV